VEIEFFGSRSEPGSIPNIESRRLKVWWNLYKVGFEEKKSLIALSNDGKNCCYKFRLSAMLLKEKKLSKSVPVLCSPMCGKRPGVFKCGAFVQLVNP
jgi:hypothetical protein